MIRFALATSCVLAACSDGAIELSNFECTPSTISVSAAPPYATTCSVDYDGMIGDVTTTAPNFANKFESLSMPGQSGHYVVTLMNDQPPPVGTLRITIVADHIQGIDGPEGDEAETTVQVTP